MKQLFGACCVFNWHDVCHCFCFVTLISIFGTRIFWKNHLKILMSHGFWTTDCIFPQLRNITTHFLVCNLDLYLQFFSLISILGFKHFEQFNFFNPNFDFVLFFKIIYYLENLKFLLQIDENKKYLSLKKDKKIFSSMNFEILISGVNFIFFEKHFHSFWKKREKKFKFLYKIVLNLLIVKCKYSLIKVHSE